MVLKVRAGRHRDLGPGTDPGRVPASRGTAGWSPGGVSKRISAAHAARVLSHVTRHQKDGPNHLTQRGLVNPGQPAPQQLSDDARFVVSEPIADIPGAWVELPEASYGWSAREVTSSCP